MPATKKPRRKGKKKPAPTKDEAIRQRQLTLARQRKITLAHQELGKIPKIVNPRRRKRAIGDFEFFCRSYYPDKFSLEWADYHYQMAADIQAAVETFIWLGCAFPRGGGKSTFCRVGVTWAVARGSHMYPVLFGANKAEAKKQLRKIRMDLQHNKLLLEDFPHLCYPFAQLRNDTYSARSQRYRGEQTLIECTDEKLQCAWIKDRGSLSAGAVIEAYGIDTAFRGISHSLPDGREIRPDIAMVDDPQTRASAKSRDRTRERLAILDADIAYLAGPDVAISVFVPCTIIYRDDLADQVTDPKRKPEYHGRRVKMLESEPTNADLWDRYGEILKADLREGGDGSAATEFYKKHRAAMDAGAKVSWEQRIKPPAISGIQTAMNLKTLNPEAFASEGQSEPLVEQDELEILSAEDISKKTTGYQRGQIPNDCVAITAFTDIQMHHMFWMVMAFTPDFTGYIVDYGGFPKQRRRYWTRGDVNPKLLHLFPGDATSQTFNGLRGVEEIVGGPYRDGSNAPVWHTMDGRELPLSRWCIDANWRLREQAVKTFAAQSPLRHVITLTYGKAVGPTQKPFSQAQRALRWKTGPGWFWLDGPGPGKGVMFDTNMWKTRVHNALMLETMSKGSIQLFKGQPQMHRMLADHLWSEKPTKIESQGRIVHQWDIRMNAENEGLDCAVGCMVGASIAGVAAEHERRPKKERRTLAELAAMASR